MPHLTPPRSWKADPSRLLARLPPVTLAFVASLLLSLVAVGDEITVGRDATLYLHAAQQALALGPGAAFQVYAWPWFSLLLAATHWLLGLPLEVAAYLWCALFMAGSCALLVALTQRALPASGYWACLVVLSVPAFNQFRDDIIREFGFWFFSILALWLALRWLERGGWLRAGLLQLAIVLAALFRLEAVIVFAAVGLCLLGELRTRDGWLRLLQINALPLAALVMAAAVLLAGDGLSQPRVAYTLSLLDPHRLWERFDLMATRFAAAALEKYSWDDARQIVFLGLSGTVLLKFVTLSGPFALPLLYRGSWPLLADFWRWLKPLACCWLLYFCVLLVFFVQERFVNSRYVSFLHWLAVPLLTMATVLFVQRFPRFTKLFVVLVMAVMVHNVLPSGAKKTHFREASAWVAEHTQPSDAIFYDDSRIAYYAGRGFPMTGLTREQAMLPEQAQRFRYFVMQAKPDDPDVQRWLSEQHKRVLRQFANRKGQTVLIIGD
ncbi:hypothetical protein [Accumulibacter sp.]|uniref:hypothetical protein n=1 Tax=Accumulibacter sp. TaxID=2053492 RepID=UPI0025DBF78F|nr:hypothetical protein [Accumulibacter sp.]